MIDPIVDFIKVLNDNEFKSKVREIPDEFDNKEELLAEIEMEGHIPPSMIYFELNGYSSPVDLDEFLKHGFNAFKLSIFSNPGTNQDTLFREIHDQINDAKADLILKEQSLKTLNDITLNDLIKYKIQACENVLKLISVCIGNNDEQITSNPQDLETIYAGINPKDKKVPSNTQEKEDVANNVQDAQMQPKPPEVVPIYIFRMKDFPYNTSRRCIFQLHKGLVREGYIDCPLPEFRKLFIRFSEGNPERSPNPVKWKGEKHNHFAYFIQCLSKNLLHHSVLPSNTEIASKLFYKSVKGKYFTNGKLRFDGKLRKDVKKRFDTIFNSLDIPKRTTSR